MDKSKIILLILLSMLALLCVGCIENSTISAENTTNVDYVENPLANTYIYNSSLNKDTFVNAQSVEDYDIATANNAFAFDMYSMIKNEDENVFFSPYSIFTAMAICYDGAEGSTKEQISNVFYYPLSKPVLEGSSKEMIDTINSGSEYYSLETANALWVRNSYPLNEQFVSNSKTYYGGKVTNVDFRNEPDKSKDIINEWVASKTNDKIKDLISDDTIEPDSTAMIITNAVYFKGKWLNEFDVGNTQKEPFYNSTSTEEETLVDMMYTDEYFSYGESEDAKIIELPYKGNDLSMYVVLPNENNIADFESRFTHSEYDKLKSTLESSNDVRIWIPKFTFETKTQLSKPLNDLGIVDAFDWENADFSGIFDIQKVSPDYVLKIDEVVHQAFVDVQEEGTEAAAATAIEAVDCSASVDVIIREFRADHPFMFFIEDKRTGCILFMGKVENPEYGEMS